MSDLVDDLACMIQQPDGTGIGARTILFGGADIIVADSDLSD